MADRRDYGAVVSLVESLVNNVAVSQSLMSDIVSQQRDISSSLLRLLDANRNIQVNISELFKDNKSLINSIQPALSDIDHSLDTVKTSVSDLDEDLCELSKNMYNKSIFSEKAILEALEDTEKRIVNAVVLRITVVILGLAGMLEVFYQVVRWFEGLKH